MGILPAEFGCAPASAVPLEVIGHTWVMQCVHARTRVRVRPRLHAGLLPDQVRRDSEQMQVVKYVDHGHYESHYDSEREGLGPCCIDPVARSMQTGVNALQGDLSQRCRLCRMMTVLYYLEDTEEGGGTVFPLADTTDEELKEWENSAHADKYKQTRECGPGLVVKPKKGKAVMWYNHKIDRGYLGTSSPLPPPPPPRADVHIHSAFVTDSPGWYCLRLGQLVARDSIHAHRCTLVV